jgi:hypothetical protein
VGRRRSRRCGLHPQVDQRARYPKDARGRRPSRPGREARHRGRHGDHGRLDADRLEGGASAIRDAGVPFSTLYDRTDFMGNA